MKVQENLDKFGIPIEEAAFSRSKFRQRMSGLQYVISRHLVMLFLFPKLNSKEHWRSELTAWAKELRRLKRGKSSDNYDREDLVRDLWMEPFESKLDRSEAIKDLRDKFPSLDTDALEPPDKFKKFVYQYVEFILSEKQRF